MNKVFYTGNGEVKRPLSLIFFDTIDVPESALKEFQQTGKLTVVGHELDKDDIKVSVLHAYF